MRSGHEAHAARGEAVGRDRQTGEQGLTLTAVLLLGLDEAIGEARPAYKTDALVCRGDFTHRAASPREAGTGRKDRHRGKQPHIPAG